MDSPLSARPIGYRRLATAVIALCLSFALAGGPGANVLLAKKGGNDKTKMPKTMLPLTVNEVIVVDGQLVALASIGNNHFPIPLNLSTRHNPGPDADCPILDLEIGEIHLDLLGLNVDTSEICLAIIAHEGEGLLGDLLCGIANLLDGGFDLGDILDLLTDDELEELLDGIRDLLDEVFGLATKADAVANATCEILSLSLGPINLNLLGLEVDLDNCANGPITIDVTADPAGGLLGDLLCELAGLLDDGIGLGHLKDLLNDIADAISGLATA